MVNFIFLFFISYDQCAIKGQLRDHAYITEFKSRQTGSVTIYQLWVAPQLEEVPSTLGTIVVWDNCIVYVYG